MSGTHPRRRRILRWLRRSGIGLLVLVSLAAAGVLIFHATLPEDDLDTVQPGSLEVATDAEGTWSLGTVTVDLTRDGLTITEEGRTVWASQRGHSFVTGARGSVGWEEHKGYFWPDVDIRQRLADQHIDSVAAGVGQVVLHGRLTGEGDPAPYTLALEVREAGGVVAYVTTDGGLDAVGWISGRSGRAGVHGFGEQFTDFDLDGRLLPIVVREQGVGRGLQPLTFLADLTNHGAGGTEEMTYAAWSSFVTDDLRGVRLDPAQESSHAFAVADVREAGRVGLEVWAPHLTLELVAASTPAELIARRAGPRRPELAEWTQTGAVLGVQGGTDKVRREVDELIEVEADLAAVWIQDWTGRRTTSFGDRLWWTWQLDTERYAGWERLVADLAEKGIRTTTYVNPFLVDADPKEDSGIRNLWKEARDAGYLVTGPDGAPYALDQGDFEATLVDLTDPEARHWFARVIADEVLGAGVDGFMADFGEGLPFDAVLADGEASSRHNQWPLLWAQTVREACRLAGKPDCVTWFRSGALGMEAESALFWNGDQLVDFGRQDGLASVLLATFSAGVSGWPLVHSDIGGYTSIDAKVRDYTRPDDLLERWTELAAFGVVMRTHEGNRPADNAQVYDSPEAERSFARMTRLFTALAPYRRSVLRQAHEEGLPALRHGWLVHPAPPPPRWTPSSSSGTPCSSPPCSRRGPPRCGSSSHPAAGSICSPGRSTPETPRRPSTPHVVLQQHSCLLICPEPRRWSPRSGPR